jgi:threonine/homoserine/homoserine lactone efflux protein
VNAGTLAGFTVVVVVAYVVPGPDWAVILRRSARGRLPGLVAAAGVQCGVCVHFTAAALGLSALLVSNTALFTVVKVIGAGYLAYLGVLAMLQSRQEPAGLPTAGGPADPLPRVFRQSMLANVLNPKAALFCLSVLPQFLRPGSPAAPQVLVLGALDVGVGVLWWALFVLLTAQLRGLMSRAGPRRLLDRATGTVLVGLSVTVVVAH